MAFAGGGPQGGRQLRYSPEAKEYGIVDLTSHCISAVAVQEVDHKAGANCFVAFDSMDEQKKQKRPLTLKHRFLEGSVDEVSFLAPEMVREIGVGVVQGWGGGCGVRGEGVVCGKTCAKLLSEY